MARKLKKVNIIDARKRDFIAYQAQKMKLDAAFTMTRLKADMRRAVRLVLLDGLTQPAAGRRVGKPKQHVYRALLVVKPILAEIEAFARTIK